MSEMKEYTYPVDGEVTQIDLGMRTENLARAIRFDVSSWVKQYGDPNDIGADGQGAGSFQIHHTPYGYESYYIATCSYNSTDKTVDWEIDNVATSTAGTGEVQLIYTKRKAQVASIVFPAYVHLSVITSDTAPDPYEDWQDKIEAEVGMATSSISVYQGIANEAKTAADTATAASAQALEIANAAQEKAEQTATSAVVEVINNDPTIKAEIVELIDKEIESGGVLETKLDKTTYNDHAITDSNISSQSVNYAVSAGTANYANSAGSAPASDVYSWAKASSKPSYSASEISGLSSASVNYATSAGSANYATSAGSAPASDVYSWAKASSKPSYSISEISGTGSAVTYGVTTSVTSGSSALVTSGGVYSAVSTSASRICAGGTYTGTNSDSSNSKTINTGLPSIKYFELAYGQTSVAHPQGVIVHYFASMGNRSIDNNVTSISVSDGAITITGSQGGPDYNQWNYYWFAIG